MADFEIAGTVVERGTRRGIQGVRVEAWDRDTRFHDMLGSAITDGAGRFRIRFTDEYFGDYGGDRLPDVFYRVFRDDGLVLSTQDHPAENVRGPRITVVLELDPLNEPRADPDRIDAATAIKAVAFFHESDFRGIGRDAGGHAKLAGGLLGRMLVNGFRKWDWKPVGPATLRPSEVVEQDTQTAQTRLAAQQITVERVEPYDPSLDRGSLQLLTAAPIGLQAGERVVLYQQDGKVKYYARVHTAPAATIDQQQVAKLSEAVAAAQAQCDDVAPLRAAVQDLKVATERDRTETGTSLADVKSQLAEIVALKASVADLRGEVVQRNRTIASLEAELGSVKAAQELIQKTDLVQRLDRLEATLGRR